MTASASCLLEVFKCNHTMSEVRLNEVFGTLGGSTKKRKQRNLRNPGVVAKLRKRQIGASSTFWRHTTYERYVIVLSALPSVHLGVQQPVVVKRSTSLKL